MAEETLINKLTCGQNYGDMDAIYLNDTLTLLLWNDIIYIYASSEKANGGFPMPEAGIQSNVPF